MKIFSKANPPLGVDLSPYQAKVYLKTFQKFVYCPSHYYIHPQKTPSHFQTWFAFITLPEMACFCRKRDMSRRIRGYIFQSFFNVEGKKNLASASAVAGKNANLGLG